MSIEEIQISIAWDVGGLGAHPTESVDTFLGHTIDEDNIADGYMDESVIKNNYSDQGDDAPVSYSFSSQPEASIIPLSLNLGVARCNEFGLTTLISQKISLREGQANDALHTIWVNLAHKTVRTAKSQKM
ncbi:hypothetical protein K503DRAFT_805909 [Rhizopogon vinicolor AM-OR11-026]|uniref:Uncharacterized protein n=1 Tax=Rhizopogon vinicolor AM-OR11-026 TaxID=1314800 RepID=A0A1B7MGB8_9AGAM|nr:hypothetical protein K503DRAFT_805909 [Rhizopogon vinicolor AM-OR11-026]